MSRTLPWRCGASSVQACVEEGSSDVATAMVREEARHLTGTVRSARNRTQQYRLIAREEPDILCRLPEPVE